MLRSTVLYAGSVWALSQGIAQLTPALGLPEEATRWFLIASATGFPLWIAFAWYYAITPLGIRRESDGDLTEPVRHSAARSLDFAIIGVLALAVVLLATRLLWHRTVPVRHATTFPAGNARSIAVLPFQNLSSDRDNDYFVAGMQELILTKLADIGDLKVISRTSTRKYASHPDDLRSIGQQLGVATILEGSVQKIGNEVLVNVQLIDARTDAHLWAQAYHRTLDNVFGVEGEVAEKIAGALQARLSPAEEQRLATSLSADQAANDLFLRAEYGLTRGETNYDPAQMRAAIGLYREATRQDPGFALAYARLSYVQSELAWIGAAGDDARQLFRQARADAERAVQLAPGLAAAHVALGYSEYWGRGDYDAGHREFVEALRLKPNDADAIAAQAYVVRRRGDLHAAAELLERALALDPRNSFVAFEVGNTWMVSGRYPEAERSFRRALELDPDNRNAKRALAVTMVFAGQGIEPALEELQGAEPVLKLQRSALLIWQRRYAEALALLDEVPDTPDKFQNGVFQADRVPKSLRQATLYKRMGDARRARAVCAAALPALRSAPARQQWVSEAYAWQAVAQAELCLGHEPEGFAAIANAERIVGQSNDHLSRPGLMLVNASLYATAGRADLAVPLLAKALVRPGIGGDYAPRLLWVDPVWDQVRDDPAFRALLAQYPQDQPALAHPAPATSAAAPLGALATGAAR